MSDLLLASLIERIRAEGPIPFDVYMGAALYDPHFGYYGTGSERTGWEGHFITSPEIDPVFGWLWARAVTDIWVAAGRPADFHVVEVGPGEGGLAHGLSQGLPGDLLDGLTYTLVERSEHNRARQSDRLEDVPVVWADDITAVQPFEVGCVILHEVLDDLPVKILERDGENWNEIHVGEQDGRLIEVPIPASDELIGPLSERNISLAQRVEVPIEAEAFLDDVLSRSERGATICVDYGYLSPDEHPQGTITCYSATGADTEPLNDPGQKNITAHVDWTWLRQKLGSLGCSVMGPTVQSHVLRSLGLRDLDDEMKRRHSVAVAEGRGADALRALSRRQALGVLVDPAGVGGLEVMVATKGLSLSPGWMKPAP